MSTPPRFVVCVLITVAALAACAPPAPLQPRGAVVENLPLGGLLEQGRIASQALANNLIGDPSTRFFYVYLPPGYDDSHKRYPVVFVLHWCTGDETTEVVRGIPRLVDSLIGTHELRETILVFPDGSNKFDGSEYMSSPTIGDYEAYLVKELVAQIDSTYRTLPSRDSRGIMGCSMGGLGSLHLALKYPDVYGVAAPMSGLFFELERDPGWQRSWELGRSRFHGEPRELADFDRLDADTQGLINLSAIAAPNPGKPPFFLDMPFKIVNGQAEIDQEVFQKVNRLGAEYDVHAYISQPIQLNALLFYRDTNLTKEALDRDWTRRPIVALTGYLPTLASITSPRKSRPVIAIMITRPSSSSWTPTWLSNSRGPHSTIRSPSLGERRRTTRCLPRPYIVPMSYGRPGKPSSGYFATDPAGWALIEACLASRHAAESSWSCPPSPGGFPQSTPRQGRPAEFALLDRGTFGGIPVRTSGTNGLRRDFVLACPSRTSSRCLAGGQGGR